MANELTRRRRQIKYGPLIAYSYGAFRKNGAIQGDPYTNVTTTSKPVGSQITDSQENEWPINPKLGERASFIFDVGGPFYSTKTFISDSEGKEIDLISIVPESWVSRNGGLGAFVGNYEFYAGPVLPVDPQSYIDSAPSLPSADAELDALGAVAISLCNPVNPTAELLTAVGEIYREGIPQMVGIATWRERALRARSAGSDYLNVQFGWKPLVSDIRKVSKALSDSDKILSQYERNSGKQVRRQFRFPIRIDETETVVSTAATPYGPLGSNLVRTTGTLTRSRRIKREQWFSGCFMYWIPPGSDYRAVVLRTALQARKLLGLSLTPDVLWNLTPWSWAFDWVSNMSNVLMNVSNFATQGLIMRYGYVMETTTVTDTYRLTGPTRRIAGGPATPISCAISFTTVVKKRRKANPFGFGISWDGLSPFQLSILAALGMSRSSGRRLSL